MTLCLFIFSESSVSPPSSVGLVSCYSRLSPFGMARRLDVTANKSCHHRTKYLANSCGALPVDVWHGLSDGAVAASLPFRDWAWTGLTDVEINTGCCYSQ